MSLPRMLALSLALSCLAGVTLAQEQSAGSSARYAVPQSARAALVEMDATVLHGSGDGDFTAILGADEVAALQALGYAPRLLPADQQDTGESAEAGGWSSYGTIRSAFLAYAANYPAIAAYEVLGPTIQGREIFALRISGNVLVEEDEPEIAFFASHHGNEFASGEIAYAWALELLDDYGTDPVATAFVDDNEIWVVPLLNPDGRELGTRENAAGIDLNRDGGFNWDGQGGSSSPWSQIESRALQGFLEQSNLSLAVTMHCSGNVFLYPWGFLPSGAPDNAVIQQVGALYANGASYQLKNSWADYETHGELLDSVYGLLGALCFTAEISNNFSLYGNSYSRNKAGMDAFCAVAGDGLHGMITDAVTGQPLRAAMTIANNPVRSFSDGAVGDLHRLVRPGTYTVTISANGYQSQTVGGLAVTAGNTTDFAVALQPDGGSHGFAITSVDQRDPTNAHNNVTAPGDALGAPDGKAASLGRAGFIVLDMGSASVLVDGPGDDFVITEALVPGDEVLENYTVFVGDAYTQNTLVGSGFGTTAFDLADAGVGSARYVKIVAAAEQPANAPLAGLELDSLSVLGGGFVTLGPGTAGAAGTPLLAGDGDLNPGGAGFTLSISSVAPNAAGILFVGLTESVPALNVVGVAFHVGVPWVLELPLVVDGSGELSFGGAIDMSLAGLDIATQALFADPTGPTGVATGSNGLRLEIP